MKRLEQEIGLPLFLLALLLVGVIVVVGCNSSKNQKDAASNDKNQPILFPPGAKNVKHLNDYWATFDLDGNHYLIHRYWGTVPPEGSGQDRVFCTMTVVPPEPLPGPNDVRHETCPHCGKPVAITPLGLIKEPPK